MSYRKKYTYLNDHHHLKSENHALRAVCKSATDEVVYTVSIFFSSAYIVQTAGA